MNGILCRPLGGSGASILSVAGSLSGRASAELLQAVRDLADEGTRWIVFDLRAGVFPDSQAVGALLLATRLCERNKGWVTLLGPSSATTSLLGEVGILDRFRVSDDFGAVMDEFGIPVPAYQKGPP